MQEFSFLIGGKAGDGVKVAGNLTAHMLNQSGYWIFVYEDYPSLITGGHNFSIIRASSKKILCHRDKTDIIIALSKDTPNHHTARLKRGTILIYDADILEKQKGGLGISMSKIVKENGLPHIARNVLSVAALAGVCGLDFTLVERAVKAFVPQKIGDNLKIAKIGYDAGKNSLLKMPVKKIKGGIRPLFSGNEAMGLGAAAAGLDFYIAYPMTPSTGLLHFLAAEGNELGVTAIQPENEIGVINMAEGAAFAGKRTMIGTAGGGFALMVEALSLSGQAEIPLAILVAQRPAPATGVPTYTAQGDLHFVLRAGHGEFPRVVVAPGDADQSFYLTAKALNLAWQYQIPAIILSDKHLSESIFNTSFNKAKVKKEKPKLWTGKGDYKRYLQTADGVSPLAFPGQKGAIVKVSGYEHDEFGLAVEEEKMVVMAVEKRLRKKETLRKAIQKMETFKTYGNKNSPNVLIVWGSNKGSAIEAAERLGLKVIQPIFLEPFIEDKLKRETAKAKKIIVAETNATGQLAELLANKGIRVDNKILKYDGRPFTVDELEEKIKKILK